MEEKEFDYINVIPLVDVMLVLLTIVLTTSTFIASGIIPVELPRASKSHEETLKTQTVEIDKRGNIYLNSKPMSLDSLRDSIIYLDKAIPILIRADRDISLQVFVDVLDIVKKLGFRGVSFPLPAGVFSSAKQILIITKEKIDIIISPNIKYFFIFLNYYYTLLYLFIFYHTFKNKKRGRAIFCSPCIRYFTTIVISTSSTAIILNLSFLSKSSPPCFSQTLTV